MVLFFGLVFSVALIPLENFLPTPLILTLTSNPVTLFPISYVKTQKVWHIYYLL